MLQDCYQNLNGKKATQFAVPVLIIGLYFFSPTDTFTQSTRNINAQWRNVKLGPICVSHID